MIIDDSKRCRNADNSQVDNAHQVQFASFQQFFSINWILFDMHRNHKQRVWTTTNEIIAYTW